MADFVEDPGWLPLIWPYKLRPRVDLELRPFLETLATAGQRVLWEAVSRCPCGAPGGQSGSLACNVCKGTGWEIGHHKQVIRAAVIGLRREQQPYMPLGPFEPGTVMMTMRAEHAPAIWDRLTLIDAVMRFSELAVRTAGRYQRLRYFIARQEVKTLQNGQEVLRVLRVIHLRRGLLEEAGPVLEEGVDFDVTADGEIDWARGDAKGSAPGVGEQFSVYYVARPSFRVISYGHGVRDARRRYKSSTDFPIYLPVQVMCRLEHLQLEPPP